jgi:hypothetical protein
VVLRVAFVVSAEGGGGSLEARYSRSLDENALAGLEVDGLLSIREGRLGRTVARQRKHSPVP